MVLVKPATVVQWHRRGFRLHLRWRSRSRPIGRPKTNTEIRQLIRQMSMANPSGGHLAFTANCSNSALKSAKPPSGEVATQGPLSNLAQLPAQPHAQYGRG